MLVSRAIRSITHRWGVVTLLGGLAIACAPAPAAPAALRPALTNATAAFAPSLPTAESTPAQSGNDAAVTSAPAVTKPAATKPAATPPAATPPAATQASTAAVATEATRLEALSDAALAALFDEDRDALGSLSLGQPNAGMLIGAVQLNTNDLFEVVAPYGAWATSETIDQLTAAARQLARQFPDGHKIYIGHLSARFGGRLRPHRSHQSGRDIDLSCCYLPKAKAWYRRATRRTMDLPRSWALLRALLMNADVEYIFLNTSVQRLLGAYAEKAGEDPKWLDSIFGYRGRHAAPLVRHAWGHDTHWHVRLYSPRAQRLGARLFDALIERRLISPRRGYIRHKVKEGESLASVAEHFATYKTAIVRTNGSWGLRPGRSYTIPVHRRVRRVRLASLLVPPRRLPPAATKAAPAPSQLLPEPSGPSDHAVAAGR